MKSREEKLRANKDRYDEMSRKIHDELYKIHAAKKFSELVARAGKCYSCIAERSNDFTYTKITAINYDDKTVTALTVSKYKGQYSVSVSREWSFESIFYHDATVVRLSRSLFERSYAEAIKSIEAVFNQPQTPIK